MLVKEGRTKRTKLWVIPIAVLFIITTLSTFMITITNRGEPVGGEFQVNTYITYEQSLPSTAMDSNGNFIITWSSQWQDGDMLGIFAKRYDSNGNELTPPPGALRGGEEGNEFRINTYTTSSQSTHSIAMNSSGDFVITWQSYGQGGNEWEIYAQRYDNSGNPLGEEFRVNTYITGHQWFPSVAMDSNSNFVITWISDDQDGDSYGIFAQRYDSNGNPLGVEFQVNTYTTAGQAWPSIAMDSNGNFVIVWTSEEQDGDGYGIFAQRYDKNGNPLGVEFQVNTYITNDQKFPSAAMDPNGNFMITWDSSGQDGSGEGIYAQRYDNNGNTIGEEFQVNSYTPNNQRFPSAAMDSNGNFIITWESQYQDGSDWGVYAQKYDSNANPFGGEFQVNTHTTDNQYISSVATDPNGNFIIAWVSWGPDHDGHGSGVYAQRYDGTNPFGIFDIRAKEISDITATISWKSNMPSNSTVEYGFSTAYGSTIYDGSKVISHNINLMGLEPGRLYHFRVSSYNNSGNYSISSDFTFTTKYSIDLEPGWNLISLPLNQTDTNLGKALENISGNYNAVQWFDTTDSVDTWKHNHTSKPSSLNDLTDADKHMGLWIHITNPLGTTLYVHGTAPDIGYVNQITLNNGWNLVGYPSLLKRLPDSSDLPAEVDMVMWYNASSGIWESWDPGSYSLDNLNLLKPGQGLWIHYTGVTDVWSLEYVN
ncbi:MAG: hypothetical protein JSW00_19255 [Thermoplasmata archaeon]|nr:MAG: hypothetical protein JSW00_19255 [Thermoplasmata archaeon]